jgi:hypothetical protein
MLNPLRVGVVLELMLRGLLLVLGLILSLVLSLKKGDIVNFDVCFENDTCDYEQNELT